MLIEIIFLIVIFILIYLLNSSHQRFDELLSICQRYDELLNNTTKSLQLLKQRNQFLIELYNFLEQEELYFSSKQDLIEQVKQKIKDATHPL